MNDSLAIPLFALLIPIVVAPTAIGCGLARKMREMEHIERMRALELGRVLPKDEPWWSPARITVAIGVVVPLASLTCAWFATESMNAVQAEPVTLIAGLVGVSSVFSGGWLANRHLTLSHNSRTHGPIDMASKPAYDPDAYDVVSRRG